MFLRRVVLDGAPPVVIISAYYHNDQASSKIAIPLFKLLSYFSFSIKCGYNFQLEEPKKL